MDFIAQRLPDGRWIRVLKVVDQFTHECLTLWADNTLSGEKIAIARDKVVALSGFRSLLTTGRVRQQGRLTTGLTGWVHRDFIRPGKPMQNRYIESFNGCLRDKCLNVEVFFTLADARRKLRHWRRDHNQHWPHSAPADRAPAEFAATYSDQKDGETALENAVRSRCSPAR